MTASAPAPEAVCQTCRFGQGPDRACVLLDQGEQDTLFEEGPCQLGGEIPDEVRRVIRRRYPFARRMEDDLASDVLLKVLQGKGLLAPGQIRHLPVLRARMREMVRNALIDGLRQQRLVTRIRCGSCVNFAAEPPPPGCHLPFLNDLQKPEPRPNPWYGDAVVRTTDPRSLEPPCDVFQWRRPETYDLLAEEIPGVSGRGSGREQTVNVLVQALDRMAQEDQRGLRSASLLFWHYLRGKGVKELADQAAVSEKTIKRGLSDGRERLLHVLQHDFGVHELGDLT